MFYKNKEAYIKKTHERTINRLILVIISKINKQHVVVIVLVLINIKQIYLLGY